MKYSAVLFDFDGVLVDTEWAIYEAWQEVFEKHGHELPLEMYTRCIGSDFSSWSAKSYLEELTGQAFDWHDLDVRRQAEIMKKLENIGPMSGAECFLKHLKAKNLPLAVVSSSSHHWVDGWLGKLGLNEYFRTTVCRGDAPRIKPAPDLFLEAAKQLSVSPETCLVIEDSLNGVRSAKAAGMQVWALPNEVTKGLDFSEADESFASFDECREKF